MGKGFFISKAVAVTCLIAAISAVATTIGLSVVYTKEKTKKDVTPPNTASPTSPTTPSTPKEPWQRYRLPDSLVPVSYNVTLWPRPVPNADGMYLFKGHSTTLNKADQIALPDFSVGAMENWGLITYRETALLYNPGVSSNGDKEWVATVISHELAHVGFGNLVTTRWWNDLWLNEGFATYVSYLGANHAEPTWNMKDVMVLNELIGVMAVDALASSHHLSSKEEDMLKPEHISALFDSITYSWVWYNSLYNS
ncbi:aminopeptidase N-like [Etheostoma spectabile]|uniref:aminopeptidase N-like n=1 Tax=Etheostoma spectabile TaxID=54343 RepID=UPI0013AF4180|nr:aminopeptidase N-like [Etheostoma spectabile]